MPDNSDFCSFCHKHKDAVQKLIVSESVAICNECVTLCQDLLTDPDTPAVAVGEVLADPRRLKDYLDQFVVGQEQAKIALAVAVVNHYKRLRRGANDPEVAKANILMLGPTGSGKTLLARTIARYLDVPFVIADATSITEAGYVGDDVESLISRLYASSGNDIDKTQRGIVFVDEIDKISRKGESASITRDVSGEGVQQALLKLVEGTKCRISAGGGRKHPGHDMVEIDTTNILFIAGGAFVGLSEILKKRLQGTAMGFNASVQIQAIDMAELSPDDLVKYGMIPEFVGRFPIMVSLDRLARQDMIRILTEVKNNYIQQYRWLFGQDEIDLEVTDDALDVLVDRAVATGTGARGLHTELERALMPHMFNLVAYREQGIKNLTINAGLVNNPTPIERTGS